MNAVSRASLLALVLVGFASTGCGGSKSSSTTCTVGDASTCTNGQVCEQVVGGTPACFAPLVIEGQVFDAATDVGISGASVNALDANGQALTLAVTTAADGTYKLTVPADRTASGAVSANGITLRVDASGYVAFPTPPRFAIPIDLTVGTMMGTDLVIQNVATDVALFPIPATVPPTTYGTIRGTSDPLAAGALAVAEQGGVAISTAIVGKDGTFVLYNVPVGVSTTVTAYASGVHTSTATTTVSAGTDANVSLTVDKNGLATVSGSLNPVNAPNFLATDTTSVLLVVESTFNDLTKAGLVPAGLRDGTLTGADTSFSIANVPPGRYVVLAAFENDGLVRDPDVTQGGASIRHIVVSDTGVVTSTPESLTGIKVTDAISTVSPGASGLEVVTSTPTLRWSKDPGADHYEVRIFDAYGAIVYQDLAVTPPSGANPISYGIVPASFVAPATGFTAGMIYQFRVMSIDKGGLPISSTEDLLGLFQYQP